MTRGGLAATAERRADLREERSDEARRTTDHIACQSPSASEGALKDTLAGARALTSGESARPALQSHSLPDRPGVPEADGVAAADRLEGRLRPGVGLRAVGGDERVAVAAERQGAHRPDVAVESQKLLAGFGVPDLDSPVLAAGGQ